MYPQTINELYAQFVNKPGASVLTAEKQREILTSAKNCRCVDYVAKWSKPNGAPGVVSPEMITTRANWLFIMTGISVCDVMQPGAVEWLPRFAVEFENIPYPRPFVEKTNPDLLDTVPARLVFGVEGNDAQISNFPNYHFEEQKNVFFVLPERATISIKILPYTWMNGFIPQDVQGAIMFSGLEISLDFLKGV